MKRDEDLAGELTFKQKIWSFTFLFPSYLFFIPLIVSFFIKFYIENFNSQANYTSLGAWLNLVVGLVSLGLATIILNDFIRDNFKAFKEKMFEDVVWSCSIGIGILYVTAIISNIIVTMLLGNKGNNGSANQQLFELLLSNNAIVMVIQAVIIAPILEELLFRGVIFRSIRKHSRFFAHAISSFLFGLLHVYDGLLAGDMTQFIHMIPYVAMGFVFSIAYEKRGNIGASILIHMANNFIAVCISIIASRI